MLKIRLRRMGSRHRPFYRVVVSDARKVPTAAALDEIGLYDPRQQPSMVRLDLERFDHWVSKGAQPSTTLHKLAKRVRNAPAVTEEELAKGAETETATEAPAAEAAEPEATAEATEEASAEAAPAEEAPAEEATAEAAPAEEAAAEEAPAEDAAVDEASSGEKAS